MSSPKPPLLMCPEGSFARFTFSRRIPSIVESIQREDRWSTEERDRLRALAGSIPFGSVPASVDASTPDGAFWQAFLHARQNARWIELPFLDAEAIFYVALLDAVDPGGVRAIDPFSSTKNPALAQATAHLSRLAAAIHPGAEAIAIALRLSLAGNVADLSQLTGTRAHAERRLLRDDTTAVVRLVVAAAGRRASIGASAHGDARLLVPPVAVGRAARGSARHPRAGARRRVEGRPQLPALRRGSRVAARHGGERPVALRSPARARAARAQVRGRRRARARRDRRPLADGARLALQRSQRRRAALLVRRPV